MKKDTRNDHKQRINDVLNHIHADISDAHSVESLALKASMSQFHFNRVFKKMMGESVHTYVRRVRLEHAANFLIFNPDSSISEILREAGFVSNSSFTHAFKECFGVTPSKWREIDIPQDISDNIAEINPLHVEIGYVPKKRVAYVRHRGYNKSIKEAWQRLEEWCNSNGMDFSEFPMIGLHHSNPNIVKKEDCHYVACLEVNDEVYRSGNIGVMYIPRMFCAKFSLVGKYGDLMKYMDYIYYQWLPNSHYEKVHLPSMAIYHKNHFIREDEKFELDFYVPIRHK
ncbi:AraC family transcriptional regulator [Sulfurospirillum arcachonense]|uniref:AraC family transcriptional regulator n=1 Tax=Sulfurospirillum arcachonense TaxID=57666 RepID=UPI00046A7662|nr:AraC family transcriptional regulator [Sulfurospirillum arcachonense]